MVRNELTKRLDESMMGDAYMAGFAATIAVAVLAGEGLLAGIMGGLVLGVGTLFAVAIFAGIFTGDDPRALRARLIASALLGVVVGELARRQVGGAGVAIGTLVAVYVAIGVWRRDRRLPPSLPSATKREDAVQLAFQALPNDLDDTVRVRITEAVDDYRQLQSVLSDPMLAPHVGLDAPGMLATAHEIVLGLLAQAPRVSLVKGLAERREHDQDAQQAALAAVVAFRERADALHKAASFAVQIAAADVTGDPSLQRDHSTNLQRLSDALHAPRAE